MAGNCLWRDFIWGLKQPVLCWLDINLGLPWVYSVELYSLSWSWVWSSNVLPVDHVKLFCRIISFHVAEVFWARLLWLSMELNKLKKLSLSATWKDPVVGKGKFLPSTSLAKNGWFYLSWLFLKLMSISVIISSCLVAKQPSFAYQICYSKYTGFSSADLKNDSFDISV